MIRRRRIRTRIEIIRMTIYIYEYIIINILLLSSTIDHRMMEKSLGPPLSGNILGLLPLKVPSSKAWMILPGSASATLSWGI